MKIEVITKYKIDEENEIYYAEAVNSFSGIDWNERMKEHDYAIRSKSIEYRSDKSREDLIKENKVKYFNDIQNFKY